MLKLDVVPLKSFANEPAAFRRLCVETTLPVKQPRVAIPAAFRRLCVETSKRHLQIARMTPAAFRRLCVETFNYVVRVWFYGPSRLQAAVC